MIKAGQLRPGNIIRYNGSWHQVLEARHYKPGKGGAFIKSRLKSLSAGSIISETLRTEDVFEQAFVEQKPMQFLYKDDFGYCFMDESTFEQIHLSGDLVGETAEYMKENMTVSAMFCDDKIVSVQPPTHVVLRIDHAEPGHKGDTVSGATKPAVLETGKEIKVPIFIEQGQKVKVDTRTGEYVERA